MKIVKRTLLFLLYLSFISGLLAQTDFFYSSKGTKENFNIRKDMVILRYNPETDVEFDLFTGRLGQIGKPTYSNVSVSSDNIVITTYEVNSNGVSSELDKITVVKNL